MIRAFNQDKPYSDFIREQIAGDELKTVTNDSLIATGFLASYAKVGFREKDNPEFRYEYLDDNIATIGRGILGLTVRARAAIIINSIRSVRPITTGCNRHSLDSLKWTIHLRRKKLRQTGSR